jgi:hypothetical protein
MNKHQQKLEIKELEYKLNEKTKELEYSQSEFKRLKIAYKLSEKTNKEMRANAIDMFKDKRDLIDFLNEIYDNHTISGSVRIKARQLLDQLNG